MIELKGSIGKFLIVFALISLAFLQSINSEDNCYIILKISGKAKLKFNNVELKRGDRICDSEEIVFSSDKDNITVQSVSRGRESGKISALRSSRNEHNEFLTLVLDGFVPGKEYLGSRGKSFIETEFDSAYVIIENCSVWFDALKYKADSQSYFILKFYQKGKNIVWRLNTFGDEILIDMTTLRLDQDTYMNLCFVESGDTVLISSFILKVINLESLNEDLDFLVKALQVSTFRKADYYFEILTYLENNYGRFNDREISNYLLERYNIE